MELVIIAAINKKRVIGKDGRLPWHIPEDLKRFKKLTVGHAVLMGRKTFESMGKPLPDRRNVVLTTNRVPGVETYASIGTALDALKEEPFVFVIGGGEIFEQFLEHADELRLTIVDNDLDGDAFFPPYEQLIGSRFRLANEEPHEGFVFRDYTTRKQP